MEIEYNKPPARNTRPALLPNQYSGNYILGLVLTKNRYDFKPTEATKNMQTKIYQLNGRLYVVPQVNCPPPEGYMWMKIGRKYGRDVFKEMYEKEV